jgi:hypothetical protein
MKFPWSSLIFFVIFGLLLGGPVFIVVFSALVGYGVVEYAGSRRSERDDDGDGR